MIKLYDSAFSPFARKVRMVLEHKGLGFEATDGLLKSNHEALKAVNGRVEVPVLVDGDIVVVNSGFSWRSRYGSSVTFDARRWS